MIRKYPLQCRSLSVAADHEQRRLKAYQVYNLFRPIHSLEGFNAKEKELEVIMYWMSFLEECEGEHSHPIHASVTTLGKHKNMCMTCMYMHACG